MMNALPNSKEGNASALKRVLWIFALIWILCALLLGVRNSWKNVRFPVWASEWIEKYSANPDFNDELKAQSDVYAEEDFAFAYPLKEIAREEGGVQKEGTLDLRQTMDGIMLLESGAHDCESGMRVCNVHADERIIGAGEAAMQSKDGIPPAIRLCAYMKYCESTSTCWWQLFYPVLLAGTVLCFIGYCLISIRRDIFNSLDEILLCGVCFIVHLAGIAFVTLYFKPYSHSFLCLFALMPFGLGPALLANMLGRRVGICSALLLSLLCPILMGGVFQFQMFIQGLIYSLLCVVVFHKIRERKHLLNGAVVVFLSVLVITFFYKFHREALLHASLASWDSWKAFLSDLFQGSFWGQVAKYAAANAVGLLLVMEFLPMLLERLFSVTTLYTFCELDSRGHELLRRLEHDAPGTDDHCHAVAKIAAAAASSVGLNEKMAEACGYFHDIGKLDKPKYYGENLSQGEKSPHDSITPLESCASIRAHVSNGLELGRKAHLPKAILEAIEQHHGNSLIAGFYAKACKLAEEQGKPKPDRKEYSYQGPRPTRPEVVLVSLADCCEAAVRSCIPFWGGTATEEQIRDKVEELVYNRIREHQLDYASITLADLKCVIDSMVASLCAKHHARPVYAAIPEAGEPKKPAGQTPEETSTAQEADK